MKEYKIEAIEWIDATFNDGMFDTDAEGRVLPAVNFGVVCSENETKVVIAQQLFMDTEEVRYIHTIPKVSILRRIKLGVMTEKDSRYKAWLRRQEKRRGGS